MSLPFHQEPRVSSSQHPHGIQRRQDKGNRKHHQDHSTHPRLSPSDPEVQIWWFTSSPPTSPPPGTQQRQRKEGQRKVQNSCSSQQFNFSQLQQQCAKHNIRVNKQCSGQVMYMQVSEFVLVCLKLISLSQTTLSFFPMVNGKCSATNMQQECTFLPQCSFAAYLQQPCMLVCLIAYTVRLVGYLHLAVSSFNMASPCRPLYHCILVQLHVCSTLPLNFEEAIHLAVNGGKAGQVQGFGQVHGVPVGLKQGFSPIVEVYNWSQVCCSWQQDSYKVIVNVQLCMLSLSSYCRVNSHCEIYVYTLMSLFQRVFNLAIWPIF